MPDYLGVAFDKAFKEECRKMKAQEKRQRVWSCIYCNISNNSSREKCNNCNAPRQ